MFNSEQLQAHIPTKKKMAKIRPIRNEFQNQPEEQHDDLVKVHTPIKAVWRHKASAHSIEALSIEHVFIDENMPNEASSVQPLLVFDSPDTVSNTEGSSFRLLRNSHSPNSSSSLPFHTAATISTCQPDFKSPVECFYQNDECESEYIVIHQANRDSMQQLPTHAESHLNSTFIDRKYSSSGDDLDHVITKNNAEAGSPDDLFDEEGFYLFRKMEQSKNMLNYFINEIQDFGCRQRNEGCALEGEQENSINFQKPHENHRQIVYDYPVFTPFCFGFLETILEVDEEREEFAESFHFSRRFSDSESSIGSNSNAIAKSLDDQSLNSDEVINIDGTFSPESGKSVTNFVKVENGNRNIAKQRNDLGIKSHSSCESFASSCSSIFGIASKGGIGKNLI